VNSLKVTIQFLRVHISELHYSGMR